MTLGNFLEIVFLLLLALPVLFAIFILFKATLIIICSLLQTTWILLGGLVTSLCLVTDLLYRLITRQPLFHSLDDNSSADIEIAIEKVRSLEEKRKASGFKPVWLYYQCKDDEILLEALEYLRSIDEIPAFEGFKAKDEADDGQKEESKEEKSSKSTEPNFDPHQILGVPITASVEQIKISYKKQMKRYHPDRVHDLGEELKDLANEKTKDIQRAFESLMPRV